MCARGRVAEKSFLSAAAITENMAQLQQKEKGENNGTSRTGEVDGRWGKEEEEGHRLWGMLYADDAGIEARSPEGLESTVTVIVTVCSAFGSRSPRLKWRSCACRLKVGGGMSFTSNAAGQVYKQTIEFVYNCTWRGHQHRQITQHRDNAAFSEGLGVLPSSGTRWNSKDRPGVPLRLKVRLLKAEVIEALLYGCMTWSANKTDYDRLRRVRVHHSMLLRCLGWRKRKRDDHTLSYADALAKTASENIEAIVRKRRILFAGFMARMGEKRLPQRVMFGELVGGEGYTAGQEKDWMVHLKEDMSVFAMKFEERRSSEAAHKAGRWFRRVEEGAESFMRKRHYAERCRAAQRHAKAAPAPSTVGISKRPGGRGRGGGGEGRGGILPERLKYGFGYYRLESVGLPMAATS